MNRLKFPPLILLLCAALFGGCESGPTGPPPASVMGAETRARRSLTASATAPESTTDPAVTSTTSVARSQQRPGLGTEFGEDRRSLVSELPFARASASRPIARAAIHYNDAEGIRAMAAAVEPQRRWPLFGSTVRRLVSFALRDQSDRLLPGLSVGDRWFVIGEQGRRYSIVLRNETDYRLEAVTSVDGLDVVTGRPASLAKRGYILQPRQRIVIDGWRRSLDTVAAFRFSSVRDSYAQRKHGDSRNVGVIGVAIFNERGTNPLSDTEVRRRLEADPFPGDDRFATPP